MKIISQTYTIKAPVASVWQAFTDPEIIKQWGGGPSKMSGDEGFDFKLWGGDIHGTNTKVVKEILLEQDWYGGKWSKPSKLIFEFSESGGKTEVKMTHSEVPDENAKDIAEGWHDYYLGPIKKLLEELGVN